MNHNQLNLSNLCVSYVDYNCITAVPYLWFVGDLFGGLANLVKIIKLTVCHYQAVYTTSIGFLSMQY